MVSLCLSVDVLLRVLTVFPYLPKSISEPLHNLMLSQMADKMFKKDLAVAYAEGYVLFTQAYGRGYGTVDFSIYSLSVQFLNRDFLVSEIVDRHDFFANLCVAIDDMLDSACGVARAEGALIGCSEERERSERMLMHPVLTHRRYNPMFADLKVRYNTVRYIRVQLRKGSWISSSLLIRDPSITFSSSLEFSTVPRRVRVIITLLHGLCFEEELSALLCCAVLCCAVLCCAVS